MSFHFDRKEGLIIVPTRLWGPTGDTVVRLALDTGATMSVANWDVVDGLIGLDFLRLHRLILDFRTGVGSVE